MAKGKYDQKKSIKFETESIKSSVCDYSGPFILVTGNVTVTASNNTDVAFKNYAPFSTCKTEINDVFIDEANHIYIAVPMYNLTEYGDNYSDISGSLWQFKRDEVPANNADLSTDNSESFRYKAILVGKTADAADGNSFVKNTKIVVPLKYLSNFWRSLEMQLINCKSLLKLNWIDDCTLSSSGDSAKFTIIDAKRHVPLLTLSTKDNVNLTKQLSDGIKISTYWNNYHTILVKVIEKIKNICELLSVSFQCVKILFALACFIAADDSNNEVGVKDNRTNSLPRG